MSRDLHWRAEENHKNLNQNSWSPGRDMNLGLIEYEVGVLASGLRRSVKETQVDRREY
jgi:hypothetical protein